MKFPKQCNRASELTLDRRGSVRLGVVLLLGVLSVKNGLGVMLNVVD